MVNITIIVIFLEEKKMNTDQIEAFLAIAKGYSYQKAANNIGSYPQKVKYHVRSLENELGVQLTYVRGRKTVLTEKGKALVPFLSQIKHQYQRIKNEISSKTSFQVGVDSHYMAPAIIQNTILQLQEIDNISININNSFSYLEYPNALIQDKIDFCFSYSGQDSEGLAFTALTYDPVMLVVNNSDFDEKPVIDYPDLAGYVLICDDIKSLRFEPLLQELNRRSIDFQIEQLEYTTALMAELAKEKRGIIIPSLWLHIIPFGKPKRISGLTVPYGVLYRADDINTISMVINRLISTWDPSSINLSIVSG